MTERRKTVIMLTAIITISLFLLLLDFGVVWSAPVQVPIKFHYGEVQSGILVRISAFETVVGQFVKNNTANIDTVLTFGDDTIWQVVAFGDHPPDSGTAWTIQINRRASNGPVQWPVTMYWSETTDSARCRFYKDSTTASSFLITGKQSFDSAFTVYRDTAYSVINDIYYSGQTNPASWIFNLIWRRIDTGQIVNAPAANKCRLYAFVKLPDGNPARGALVTVTRGGAYNAVSTSTTKYAITADAISVRTDSVGKFQLDVVASNQFADTANAYYNVSAKWKAVELFRVNHIYAPANTSINVLDSLNR